MVIYFDESYDNAHDYLLYGALFVPRSAQLHQRFLRIRQEMNYKCEVKYNRCRNQRALSVCQRVIDAFIEDASYFRCVVVDQHGFDYSKFAQPHESLAIAQARAYKKFAEMLLDKNLDGIENAVFLADKLTRCNGDEFLERIRERFNPPGRVPTFRHVDEVSSNIEQYQSLQVCDLLLGCVLNNLKQTTNRFKNDIRKHLCSRLSVQNFLLSTWKGVSLSEARNPSTKFNVWYWSAGKKPR